VTKKNDDLSFALPGLSPNGENADVAPNGDKAEDEGIGKLLTTFVGGRFQAVFSKSPGQAARVARRIKARDQRRGQRKYNRQQAELARKTNTLRAQMRVIKGEVEVTPAARKNLERAILADQRRHEASLTADQRRQDRSEASIARLSERRAARFAAGRPRGKDLRVEVFEQYKHLLPEDYFVKPTF
jgi:hypothetical protein